MSEVWRDRLHARFAGQPTPLLIVSDQIWTGASLWAGARQWVGALRAANVIAGERVVCALPAGAAFVQLLLACFWEEISLAVVSPMVAIAEGDAAMLDELDARLLVRLGEFPADVVGVLTPGAAGWPEEALPALRASTQPPTRDVRLLLRTSGTTGAPRWVAISDGNLCAVLDSHANSLALEGGCVLSVLPWHHAFGLVLGLLASLLQADEIVRDANDGRDFSGLLALAQAHPITHVDLVPILATRLFGDPRGEALLHRLRGGVVGGAAVSASLAAMLGGTALRVGYGQTEASPGIALGAPGEWSEGFLGRPVGCAVRIDDDGVLAFRGKNACVGFWEQGRLNRLDPERWVRTGDLVERLPDDGLRIVGRDSDRFKLANGRMVDAARYEAAIRLALPAAREVLVRANGEDAIEVLLTVGQHTEATLSPTESAAVRAGLGALASRLSRVTLVPFAHWRRTAKGDVLRSNPLLAW